jgi:hypothetical protein
VQWHVLTTVTHEDWTTVSELVTGIVGVSVASRRESVRRAVQKLADEGVVEVQVQVYREPVAYARHLLRVRLA